MANFQGENSVSEINIGKKHGTQKKKKKKDGRYQGGVAKPNLSAVTALDTGVEPRIAKGGGKGCTTSMG